MGLWFWRDSGWRVEQLPSDKKDVHPGVSVVKRCPGWSWTSFGVDVNAIPTGPTRRSRQYDDNVCVRGLTRKLNRELHHRNLTALREVILEEKAIYMVFEYAEHDFLVGPSSSLTGCLGL